MKEKFKTFAILAILAALAFAMWNGRADAQTPAQARGRAGGGGGRRAIQVMTLTPNDWKDGGVIPAKHAQPGRDVSPGLAWSVAPQGTASFALLVHDVDTPIGTGTDDLLHWMVWNIPGSATSLPEGIERGAERADGSRQISATGPNYRGPAAPTTGPMHHYLFELFALDTTIAIPAVGASPPLTRAAVTQAMAGHIRGKATIVGLYRREPTK
jgi:Raf kinase inhibitor-like YbhB/YbcL family protein